jgi:transposase-like protein
MRTSVTLYHRHRFPAEIISHCVWLYFRFALSFRDVEEMMASRGVSLTYETVREWSLKFGLPSQSIEEPPKRNRKSATTLAASNRPREPAR